MKVTHIITTTVVALAVVCCSGVAQAATRIWDGGGTDGNWTTADNWDTGAPVADDKAHFEGTTQPVSTNDLASGTEFDEIKFLSSAGTHFTVEGNKINLGGNIIAAGSGAGTWTHTVNCDVHFVGGNRQFNASGDETLLVNGAVTVDGTYDLLKFSAGTLRMTASNSYDQLGIKQGTVQVTTGHALGAGSNADLYGDGNTDVTLEFVGGSDILDYTKYKVGDPNAAAETGGVIFKSSLTNGAKVEISGALINDDTPTVARTVTLAGASTADNEVSGVIKNNDNAAINVSKTDGGTWTLSGFNLYTGTTAIADGILNFDVPGSLYSNDTNLWTESRISVSSGATLAANTWQFGSTKLNQLISNLSAAGAGGFADGAYLGLDTTEADLIYWTQIDDTAEGSLGLRKMGSYTLTIPKDNTYTGGTIVDEGVLQIGNGFGAGSLPGDTALASGTTLRFYKSANDTTVSGVISGGGDVVISNTAAGKVTILAGDNTCTGDTTVVVGTLRVGAYGDSGDIAGNIDVASGMEVIFARTNSVNDNIFTYDGVITGAGSVRQTGNNDSAGEAHYDSETLQLNGNSSYSGGTFIDAETSLLVSHNNALGTGPVWLLGLDSVLILGDGIVLPNDIYGTNTITRKAIFLESGAISAEITGDITFENDSVWDQVFKPLFGKTLTISGNISDGAGSGSWTMDGAGTLVLEGTVALDGDGRVGATGTLLIDGDASTSSGTITVIQNAEVGGTGSYGGTVAYNENANAIWRLMSNTESHDPLALGNVTFDTAVDLVLEFNTIGSAVDWQNNFWFSDHTWTVFDVTSAPDYSALSLDTSIDWPDKDGDVFSEVLPDASFSIQQSGNDLLLVYNAPPVSMILIK